MYYAVLGNLGVLKDDQGNGCWKLGFRERVACQLSLWHMQLVQVTQLLVKLLT